MEEKVLREDYPYNLLFEARGLRMLELPPMLTKDVQAGIAYALFTLEETEQNVLDKKFRLGVNLSDDQQQIAKKALRKLTHPCRWSFIRYGVIGCTEKKVSEAKKKGFAQGYQEGFVLGMKSPNTSREEQAVLGAMDFPVEAMQLSSRVCNALRRGGCSVVRDVAAQSVTEIRRMRNLGEKGIREVVQVLRSYGLSHTEWELF